MAKTIKGRKFVATAATAALVASAIVPVASAASLTDADKVAPWAKDSVNYVVDQGIMAGNADGTFAPQGTFTRAQAAQVIVNYLGLEKSTEAKFSDVPADAWYAGAVNAAAKAGKINGVGGDRYNPTANLSRQDAAIIFGRLLNLDPTKADLSVLDQFKDKAAISATADDYVALFVAAGVLNGKNGGFVPTGNITREELAHMIANADKADKAGKFDEVKLGETTTEPTPEPTPEPGTAELKSVSAINAKTIEVTFDNAVDTSKATIELLRGTFKQNHTVKWSDDKKSVQLTAPSNYQAADYTVNITGLADKKLTGTVKIEEQKVASIEISNTIAIATSNPAANGTYGSGAEAKATYVVKDQYGTDITKSTTLTTNDNTNITASAGVITVKVTDKKIGDILPVVLIHSSGKTTTANLTLSAKSVVTDLGVAGIFNAKGEEVALNDASKLNDVYLVLDIKDQYGEEIVKTADAVGLTFSSTNTNNLTIDPTLYVEEIDGENKLVIKFTEIKKAGSTNILLISTTNGKSLTYTVNVAETAAAEKVAVGANEIVVKDEEVLIPLTVTDKAGNVITDRDLLSSSSKGIKVGNATVNKTDLVVKDGELFYKTTFTTAGTNVLLFSTATNPAPTTYTANVKAAVIPTLVTGFKKPLVLAVANGAKAVTVSDVIVEDQYGRVIPAGHTSLSGLVVNATLVGTSDKVTVTSNLITPVKNGTAKVKLALAVQNGTIDSSVEQTVTVTDGKEYTGYEAAEIGLVKAGVTQELSVSGLLNGGKVALKPSEYYAEITGGLLASTVVVDANGEYTIADTALNLKAAGSSDRVDTEFTVKVTVNATGEVIEQKFTVSNKSAVTADFFFTSSATGSTAAILGAAKTITDATIKSGLAVTALKATDDANTQLTVYTTDQYGNEAVVAIPATATVTIVPSKPSEVAIANNGKTNATVSLVSGVTKSNVTYKVVIGSKTVEIPVLVTIDPVTATATYATVTGTANTALATAVAPTVIGTVTGYAVKTGSALPTGLSLNTTTGEITGTPTVAGSSTAVITYTYVNEYGVTVTKEVTVTFTIAS